MLTYYSSPFDFGLDVQLCDSGKQAKQKSSAVGKKPPDGKHLAIRELEASACALSLGWDFDDKAFNLQEALEMYAGVAEPDRRHFRVFLAMHFLFDVEERSAAEKHCLAEWCKPRIKEAAQAAFGNEAEDVASVVIKAFCDRLALPKARGKKGFAILSYICLLSP